MTLPIDIATANVQAQIDAAPDCSTVRITERLLDKLVLNARRKLTVMPAEDVAEVYIRQFEIRNSKECRVRGLTFAGDGETYLPYGVRIWWDGGTGHNALNNIVDTCEFKKYAVGVLVGALPEEGPPMNQYSAAFNRMQDCLFENCYTGLLINSANAQSTITRDCVWSANGIGTHVMLGQYKDYDGTYLLSLETDILQTNAIMPTRLVGTYTEQSHRFFESEGPTSAGWPTIMEGVTVFSGTADVAQYPGKRIAIIHRQAQLLMRGCVVGITNFPLYLITGGNMTTLLDVHGSQFFTQAVTDPNDPTLSIMENPFLTANGTQTVNGQYILRDQAQSVDPQVRTRVSLVNAKATKITTPDNSQDFLQFVDIGGPQAIGDDGAGFRSDFRIKPRSAVFYDVDTGVVNEKGIAAILS